MDEITKKIYSAQRLRCPNYFNSHRKVVLEDVKRPFRSLNDIVSGLLISEEYQQKNITGETTVCPSCYEKLAKIAQDNVEAQGNSLSSSSNTHSSEMEGNMDSQASICSVELQADVNNILSNAKIPVSPLKYPLNLDISAKENYVHRKRKQVFDSFFHETDPKIRKLYDVREEKIEFSECINCNEWYKNFSEVLKNADLQYREKVRLLTLMPSRLSRTDILSNISGTTEHMIRKSYKIVSTSGLYKMPDPYCGNSIREGTLQKVAMFYLDDDLDCSRQSPNKNDVITVKINGVNEVKVKRFLTRSIQEIFLLFKERNLDEKISRSKFYDLRPKWVINQPLNNACLCIYCANYDLLITALKNITKRRNSEFSLIRKEVLAMIVCSRENISCILRECKNCDNKDLSLELLGLDEDSLSEEITFAVWEKNDLIKKITSITIFLNELRSQAAIMSKHEQMKKLQQTEIKLEKEKVLLVSNHLILHGDFAENWSVVMKDAIQSYHWTNTQISIFTAVCYIGDLTKSFAIISDDRKHDSAHALFAMNCISKEMAKFCTNKIDKTTIITDGAAGHFKNRFQLYELGTRFKEMKWIFSATGHGKGACDGVGGLVKHYATIHNLSTSQVECIKNAEEFVKYVKLHTKNIQVIYVKSDDIQEFRTQKTEEWTDVTKVPGIRETHVWEAHQKIDKNEVFKIDRKMRKSKKHDWKDVHFTK